jgi:hypothetical protein
MNYQKDTTEMINKNKLSKNGGSNISNYYNVFDQSVYIVLAERSQKLVTALYMITDLMESHDPMRNLLRKEITHVMSLLFETTHAPKTARVEILSQVNNLLFAVSSYLGVMYSNGFVSKMNYDLVHGEINNLKQDLQQQLKKSLPYDKKQNNNQSVKDFTFSADFFHQEIEPQRQINSSLAEGKTQLIQKDINSQPIEKKKTSIQSPVFVQKESLENKIAKFTEKKSAKSKINKKISPLNQVKTKRKEDILKILKQKPDASINDICALFKDCSSKTIQRDLTDLIDQGLVQKEGSRRWSKYNLTY